MSYTDLRDFTCEFSGPVGDVSVQIEKLGGGTDGKSYTGTWRYIVSRDGVEIRRGQDLNTPADIPWTHEDAKWIIGSQFTDVEEMWWSDHSDYPHLPGRLYECHACQERCHCGEFHDEGCQPGGTYAHPLNDGKLHHTTECAWPGHENAED